MGSGRSPGKVSRIVLTYHVRNRGGKAKQIGFLQGRRVELDGLTVASERGFSAAGNVVGGSGSHRNV